MRVLRQDRRTAEGLDSLVLPPDTSLGLDLDQQGSDALAIEIFREATPARQRIEGENLDGRVLQALEVLTPAPGGVLFRAIKPEALQGFAGEQGGYRVGSRPVLRTLHKSLFGSVAEEVRPDLDEIRPGWMERLVLLCQISS